jgi:hypothetical protein
MFRNWHRVFAALTLALMSTDTIRESLMVRVVSEIVTLEIPTQLVQQAKEIALLTHRPLEAVLVEWINRASSDLPVESLPDEHVLVLCDSQISAEQQASLSDLLGRNQEGQLQELEAQQLDELMQVYRRGLVRKARALQVAVSRGLRSPLES